MFTLVTTINVLGLRKNRSTGFDLASKDLAVMGYRLLPSLSGQSSLVTQHLDLVLRGERMVSRLPPRIIVGLAIRIVSEILAPTTFRFIRATFVRLTTTRVSAEDYFLSVCAPIVRMAGFLC